MTSNSVPLLIRRTVTNAKVFSGALLDKVSNAENAESSVTKNAKIFSTQIAFNVSNARLRGDLLGRRTTRPLSRSRSEERQTWRRRQGQESDGGNA